MYTLYWKKLSEVLKSLFFYFRSIPTFYKFTCLCSPLGLDGFVYEIPGNIYGEDVDVRELSLAILHSNKNRLLVYSGFPNNAGCEPLRHCP